MSLYQNELQRSLDLIVFRNRSREYLNSNDEDVLTIFSGDEKEAREGLRTFHTKHEANTWVTCDGAIYQIKVIGLFPDKEQKIQKDLHVGKRRFKKGKFPKTRPSRREMQ